MSPRKPPAALRIVNRLAGLAPAEVKALVDATARLRSGDGLREAMADQRDALAKLADAVGRGALEEGVKPSLTLQRRVLNTVRAAAVSEPDALRHGTLAHELQPAGFEGLEGVAAPRAAPEKPKADPEEKREKARIARELREAERIAHQAAATARRLAEDAGRAEEVARHARGRAEEARHTAEQAAARALELQRKG